MTVWRKALLGDCCEIVSGATPSTAVDDYWDGDICWATPKDLSNLDGHYISDTPRKLTKAGLASCSAAILPPNSVLFSSRAPIGHVGINTVPMATNQGFKSLVPGPEVNVKFLFHWLRANRSFLEGLGVGATFKEVSKAVVTKVEIPLPPLAEQRRIAAILDKADALRTKRREALAQLDRLAQSIFVEMFGDPVIGPKNCSQMKLADCVASMEYGPRFYDESYSDDGIRIVRITDLDQSGALDFEAMPRMNLDEQTIERFALQSGDIVFARTGATVGKVALIRDADPPCIAGAYFIRLRFAESVLPVYAVSVLRAKSIQALIAKQSRQAAQQNFSGPGLRALPMPVPPMSAQQAFARLVEKLLVERRRLDSSLTEIGLLFSSLQHRAFLGEL